MLKDYVDKALEMLPEFLKGLESDIIIDSREANKIIMDPDTFAKTYKECNTSD